MALKKCCNYPECKRIVDYGQRYCDVHQQLSDQKQQQSNKDYDNSRRTDREWLFYKTNAWEQTRCHILSRYNYMDLYSYYVEHIIVQANTVHHIVEVRDDWSKRLDVNNLIPCTNGTHTRIHKLYLDDKKNTQDLLRQLINKYDNEFRAGGY
jgi:hypothetical protein